MTLTLNTQAGAVLGEIVRKNNGQLPTAVEEKLKALDAQETSVQLTLAAIEELLTEAMPEKKQDIDAACNVGAGYHPDGKNAQFLTHILSLRIEDVVDIQAGRQDAVAHYDPMIAEFTLDPQAKNMLLFNARNVDESGNPLLMKIVMRMSTKLEAVVIAGETEIDALVKKTAAALTGKVNGNFTEADVRASFGLPQLSPDIAADANSVQQITANLANWAAQVPGGVVDRDRIQALTKELDEAKTRYIDGQLPELDLDRYRREPPDAKPDVTLVGAKATYVKSVDFNKTEFEFGDPLKQISLSSGGKELSASVFTQPENEQFNRAWNDPAHNVTRRTDYDRRAVGVDSTPVRTFDKRIRVEVRPNSNTPPPPGAWLDEANLGQLRVNLHVDRGLMFEPGANAQVAILSTRADAAIRPDDAHLTGNAPNSTVVDTGPSKNMTMRQFLNSNMTRTVWADKGASDRSAQTFSVAGLVYANAASVHVGARTLSPLGDTVLKQTELAANKIKLEVVPSPDDDKDGVRLKLTLDDGFLGADRGKASVKGWTMQVGYVDASNKWVEEKTRTLEDAGASKKQQFTFDIDEFQALQRPGDAAGVGAKMLEVRLYNADGVPAERIKIPFREAVWGDG